MHPKYWKRKALNHVYRDEAGEGSAGGGALDMNSAAAAFASFSAPVEEAKPAEAAPAPTSEEAAAEQIAQEEAKAEAAPEEQADDSADTVTIKVDGKDVQMTKAELAEHYKNGLRQADYTRKTMETAEARKAAEAEANKAKAERDSYAEKLQHFAIQQNGTIQELQSQLTEELLTSDPVEYLKLERTLHARQAQLQQAQQELQQIGLQQKHEQEQSAQSYRAQQLEALQAKLPEWKDPAKAKAEAEQIKDFLSAQEFSAEDIAQLGDHRLILLARKAMQFDALQAKAREAVKKVQAAPAKVEKPGNSQVAPTDGRTRAMKQLESSGGSLSSAANVFAQFL
jgi:hypothetical protein